MVEDMTCNNPHPQLTPRPHLHKLHPFTHTYIYNLLQSENTTLELTYHSFDHKIQLQYTSWQNCGSHADTRVVWPTLWKETAFHLDITDEWPCLPFANTPGCIIQHTARIWQRKHYWGLLSDRTGVFFFSCWLGLPFQLLVGARPSDVKRLFRALSLQWPLPESLWLFDSCICSLPVRLYPRIWINFANRWSFMVIWLSVLMPGFLFFRID